MSLLRDIAGLYGDRYEGDEDARATIAALLTGHARHFLQGGGSLSLRDWLDLDQPERAAFTAAGKALAVEQAIRIGQSAQGDLAALRVKAEIDGGQDHDRALLRTAVQAAAREVRHGAG